MPEVPKNEREKMQKLYLKGTKNCQGVPKRVKKAHPVQKKKQKSVQTWGIS